MKQSYLAKLFIWLFLFTGLGAAGGAAYAQSGAGSVSGRVVDESNTGLPGVTVLIEGTTLGNSTNSDGTFNIQNVPAGSHTVVISFVGYNTVRRPITVVAGQNTAVEPVGLSENATQLAEAVVVGYGTQRRQDVTGAVATVDSRQFVKGQITNPEQLIQGKVSGVNITPPGGQPGGASQILIRGGSSLGAGGATNEPLIVVDGVPLNTGGLSGAGNPLTLINPNDIETFSVLKDASATAIYGSRASNGVILITTKKGLSGEPTRVSVQSQFSISKKYREISVLSADSFRANVIRRGGEQLLGTANTNWQDEIFRTAYSYDNNVALSGSVGKVPYRVSYNNLNQQGILKTSELVRNSVSVGLTPRLFNDKLRVDINLKGAVIDNRFADQGAIGAAVAFDPTKPVRVDTANALYGGYYTWTQFGSTTPNNLATANPVALLELKRDRSTVKRSIGNIQFDYQLPFVSGLRANYNLGYDVQQGQGNTFVPAYAAFKYSATADRRGDNTSYSQKRNSWVNEFYLNYSKQISENFRVEALAGYSYQNFFNYTANLPSFAANGTTITNPANQFPGATENALQSYYGRLNLNYGDRYLLTATLRNDQSSRFAPSTRNGYFPAVGLGYRIKGEEFLKNTTAVSELKLRAGYGITGQQNIGQDYGYIARYTVGQNTAAYQLGNQFYTTLRPEAYLSSIKWEETTTYNAGLDYGFADDRITGTVDVYYRRSKDLLVNGPLPAGSNFNNQIFYNIGNLTNRGVEFAVNFALLRRDNLTWNVNYNITYNKNELTKLTQVEDPLSPGIPTGGISGGVGNNIQTFSVGYAAPSFYVYEQKYDDQGRPIVPTTANGGINAYVDQNGDGKITTADLIRYKQPNARIFMGLSSNLTYRNLSLAFTMRSNLGQYAYNNVQSNLGAYNQLVAPSQYLSNLTTSINDTRFDTPQYFSSYYVQNAQFIRMDNITLGYTFGKVFGGASNLGVSVAVQNVFTITPYQGLDPEVVSVAAPSLANPNPSPAVGIDNNFYPRPRTVTLGLNVGF